MTDFSDKTVYQIYPKSFRDTNGDGFGDIPGVIEKLDYLQGLGVDYLWLTPFFPSPQHDNGYDVADYLAVDPKFGTMEDLEELICQSGKRGMRIMLDMVFNHTSTCHPWFQRALAGEEKYQNYYIFKEGTPDHAPTNWQSKFGGSAWEYVQDLKKWYLRLYDVTQADLNWDNPEVRGELKRILRFWKEKRIRAFRFDVINLVSKPEVTEDDFEEDMDFPDYVEVTADVEDFSLEMTVTVASAGLMSGSGLSQSLDFEEMDSSMDEMTDAMGQLKNGGGELAGGLDTLKDSMGSFSGRDAAGQCGDNP